MNLWMVFRPGDYIYTKVGEIERVLRFRSMTRCKCPRPWCEGSRWSIVAECIDYDGTDFGYSTTYCFIRQYDGFKPLRDLRVVPPSISPKQRCDHKSRDGERQEIHRLARNAP